MLTYTRHQSEAVLFKGRTAVVQKAECLHAVLSNSNNAMKSYRLNKKHVLLIFAGDVFYEFDYYLIFFLLVINLINLK